MFKKGQIVKSKLTGHYFKILNENLKWPLVEALRSGAIVNLNPCHVSLIANNYQPKAKTTAH